MRLIALSIVALFVTTAPAAAASCSIGAVTIPFGTVNPLLGATIKASASFSVTCTGFTPNGSAGLCVEIGPGTTSKGQRVMTNGSVNYLYELYSDAAYSQVWGSWGASAPAYGSGGVQYALPLNASGAGSHTFTIYAAILSGQTTQPPATYTGGSTAGNFVGLSYGTSCPGSHKLGSVKGAVTATVAANCNVSTTNVNFGSTPTTIASAINTTGTITAQCTNGSPYAIGLGSGLHASGAQRRMQASAGQYVSYQLYLDSSHTRLWGAAKSSTTCSTANGCDLGTGTGSNQAVPVYAQAPAQTAPASGSYSDTVVVTVMY